MGMVQFCRTAVEKLRLRVLLASDYDSAEVIAEVIIVQRNNEIRRLLILLKLKFGFKTDAKILRQALPTTCLL